MQPPRDDHDAPAWLTATEFKDTDAALEAKVKQLAELMRASKKTVSTTFCCSPHVAAVRERS